jgi:Zn-finger nucleic acid-binding protein
MGGLQMNCPKCGAETEKVAHGGIDVDRCTACKGIWFDVLERERLVQLKDSEKIDIGDPKVGSRWNKTERIDCPLCRTRMIRMVDPQQPHIWYEACKSCNGIFLDAGEFRDLKQHTLLDRLKDLFAPERD